MIDASAPRSTPAPPRTPLRISAALMPSTISAALSGEVGARRNVTSRSTSTSTPPMPNVTTGPNDGSVMAPTSTSVPSDSICCTWTPVMSASDLYALAFSMMVS